MLQTIRSIEENKQGQYTCRVFVYVDKLVNIVEMDLNIILLIKFVENIIIFSSLI